jgi:hypothetical protein
MLKIEDDGDIISQTKRKESESSESSEDIEATPSK